MLRKNPSASVSSSTRSGRGIDDNEKGSKMKRRKESQTKVIFYCLALISVLGLLAKLKVNHFHKFTPTGLRKGSSVSQRKVEETLDTPSVVDFLPPHSLYNIEVEDIFGEFVNFSKFRGMVTLVVNVACS